MTTCLYVIKVSKNNKNKNLNTNITTYYSIDPSKRSSFINSNICMYGTTTSVID